MSYPKILQRHPLAAYVTLAYLITWTLLLPLVLTASDVWSVRVPSAWHAFGALGPFTAAFLVIRADGGSLAVRNWLGGFRRWRVGARWWLLAVGSPVVLFIVSALLVRLVSGAWPAWTRLTYPEYANATWLFDLLFVSTVAYGLGEEPGWRGFLLTKLHKRHGSLVATIMLTPIWAAWHLPAFFYRPSYAGGLPTAIGFMFGLFAGAIVLTFLYNGAQGSLLLVATWHILINVAMQVAAVVSQPVLATMNVLVALGAVMIAASWIAKTRRTTSTNALTRFSGTFVVAPTARHR